MMINEPKAIAIVKLSSLGDILQGLPVASLLKQHYPNTRITWIVEEKWYYLLKAHPAVDEVIAINSYKWRKKPFALAVYQEMRDVRRKLRDKTYDAVFDLQGNLKSSLVLFFLRTKKKVGFSFRCVPEKLNLLFTHQKIDIDRKKQITEQYLDLIRYYYQFEQGSVPFSTVLQGSKFLSMESFPLDQPRLMICPGSAWTNKSLEEHVLVDFLMKIHHKYHPYFVFIWGSSQEKMQAHRLKEIFLHNSEVIGNLPIPTWQDLMGCMQGVICVDSSALHLAAMANVPTFSIFGPTSPTVYKPKGDTHHFYAGECPFSIDFVKRCPVLRTCPSGACIKNIPTDKLFDSFMNWWDQLVFKK